jgi:hypothetical protein
MLQSRLRLGPLSLDLNASTFHKTALGLTAAAAISTFAMGADRATAQDTAALKTSPPTAARLLTTAQCQETRGAIIRTLREFKGKMSAPMARSLGTLSDSCDLATKIDTVPGVDDKAWDVFIVRLNVIRTSAATPATLTQ